MIGIETSGYTALGTGTAKAELGGADVILPAWARAILAVMPQGIKATPVAVEPLFTKFSLESDDFDVAPYEVPHIVATTIATTVSAFHPKIDKWSVGQPVKGGDRLRCYGTPLVANTTAGPTCGLGIVLTDGPAGFNSRNAKMGTATAMGTTATSDVAGTAYTFTSGHKIVEVFGVGSPGTIVATDAFMGYIKFTSSEFVKATPLKLPLQPMGGLLGTVGNGIIDGVSRAAVDVDVLSPCTVQDYLYAAIIPASNTKSTFVSGVIFE